MDNYYSNNEFDINKFNTVFEENQVNLDKKKDNELDGMKQVIEKEQLHDMSLGKIFVNMKEEIFGILYDIITINFNSFDKFFEIFTKKNRLFHIGLFLIIICIFLYIISYLFFYPKPEQKGINADLYIPNSNNNYSNNKLSWCSYFSYAFHSFTIFIRSFEKVPRNFIWAKNYSYYHRSNKWQTISSVVITTYQRKSKNVYC